jgi:hypothetical protein
VIRGDGAVDVNACDALSVSVWIKIPPGVRDATVFNWPEAVPNGGTYLALSKGRFRCRFGSGTSETVRELPVTYTPDTWHHVVMTHDRAGANIVYLDGEVVDSRPSLPLQGNADRLLIGCAADREPLDRPFVGLIDELMVFRRALSPSEIKALSHCVRPPRAAAPRPPPEAE